MLSFLNVPLRAWDNMIKNEHLALILNATKFKNQRANKEEFNTSLKIILKSNLRFVAVCSSLVLIWKKVWKLTNAITLSIIQN